MGEGQRSDAEGQRDAGGKRATLRDVARLAGVSHQTVSRAINDKGEIDPATRQRVLDAARELRYRPSRHARGLVRPDSTVVGLIVPDVVNPFFPELIAGVIDAATARGWQVIVGSSQEDPAREPGLLRSLGGQADALIGYLFQDTATIGTAVEGVPLVLMNRRASGFGAVQIDVAAGIREAVRHLLARGHRRIGMIDCVAGEDPSRRAALLAAAAELGAEMPPDAIVDTELSLAGGGAGLEQLHDVRPDVTAVLAFNDLVALGAYRAARRRGLSIPGDLALVGFDGLSIGDLLDPPLTSIRIDKRRMGELAVAQAETMLAGGAPGAALIPTELLVRGSA